METCMFLCLLVTCKHKNMHVSMYSLHLVLTFTPHYIITDKRLYSSSRTNSVKAPFLKSDTNAWG